MKVKPTHQPGKVVLEATDKDAALLASGAATTLRIRKILAPVDFSECSRQALRYAVAFARQFGAAVSLIHVVGLNYGGGEFGVVDLGQLEGQLAEAASKRLKQLIETEVPAEIRADAIVRVGAPAAVIADCAKQRETDLIILSTHGYRGLKHLLLGSTAENVARLAPCPVLIVREHEHEFVTG